MQFGWYKVGNFLNYFIISRLGLNIESLVTEGLKQSAYIPKIIETETAKVQTGALLDVVFETNPLDETCGQKLVVNIAPICITYDSKTFIKVAEIFKTPNATKLEKYVTCINFIFTSDSSSITLLRLLNVAAYLRQPRVVLSISKKCLRSAFNTQSTNTPSSS